MVDSNNYVKNASLTDKSTYSDILDRLSSDLIIFKIRESLKHVLDVSEELNKVKRFIFYKKDIFEINNDKLQVEENINFYKKIAESDNTIRTLYGVIGMVSEVGELIDVLYRDLDLKLQDSGDQNTELSHIEEELGDINWYQALIIKANNLDFSNILEKNINKLKLRYPNKFNESDALNRDILTEHELFKDGKNE